MRQLDKAIQEAKELVAVPVRGADCVLKISIMNIGIIFSCRPREGCGLRL